MLADLAIRFSSHQPEGHELRRQMNRWSFHVDMSRLGLRMTTFLRDRLRSRWLRIKRNDR